MHTPAKYIYIVKPIPYLRYLNPFLNCYCLVCFEIPLASLSQKKKKDKYFNESEEQMQSPKMANFSPAVI